jgi:hypothetical protein
VQVISQKKLKYDLQSSRAIQNTDTTEDIFWGRRPVDNQQHDNFDRNTDLLFVCILC